MSQTLQQNLTRVPAESQTQEPGRGDGGRGDAKDAQRAFRKWIRPACGHSATRTKSVTAIETRPFAPGKFQPENVFEREEGVSFLRVSRVE